MPAWAIAIVLTTLAWLPTAYAAAPCDSAIGQWNWFIGGKVTFAQGGSARWTPANAAIPPASGVWTCDAVAGKYVVTWQNGFVDTLTLSPDGTKLTGTSSNGVAVSGWRAKPASVATPSSPTTGVPPSTAAKPGPSPKKPPTSGAIDHNPSVSEILKNRPKPDPRGWTQGDRPPQKGPKPFEGW